MIDGESRYLGGSRFHEFLSFGVSGLPILHTCGHRKLHTWRFDLAGGRVGM